ncbi:paralemmin-3 [Ctenodactylus gundi]
MALDSQAWAPATPTPMAESSLYRQRLEVIAEKRRLQEEISAARRELEEEKLRVERLKRKSLRERWLMDGAAEGPEPPEDPAAKDPQSPERQAQARIRDLEDSLFTLQSQLQLLQSASTGAQHKPAGRPTWRRQGHRPLSQPPMETGSAGQTDTDKGASLPASPVGASPVSPESRSQPKEEAAGVLSAPTQVPGHGGAFSEANGPCPGPSPPPGQELGPRGGGAKATGGDVVEVVWAGLRPTEDCALGATGRALEARVEEVVLAAVGHRPGAGSPERPAWVKGDRGVTEVVWEGLGVRGPEAPGELGGASEGAAGTGPPGPRERLAGDAQEGPGGEEGSFVWVERVAVGEEWEELRVEGPLGGDAGGPGDAREAEAGGAETAVGAGEGGSAVAPGTEGTERDRDGAEELGSAAGAQEVGATAGQVEGPVRAEGGEAPPEEAGRTGEGTWGAEAEPEERKGGEVPLGAGKDDGEKPLEAEGQEAGGAPGVEENPVAEAEPSPEEQRESGEGTESWAEEGSEAGAPLGVAPELKPEAGLQSPEKQEGSLEEAAAGEPHTAAEGQSTPGDAAPLLAEAPAPEQPAESQPLLRRQPPGPSAHPAPTYAPARQPEPAARAEGEEAGGPKQKTCQCCAVM